MILLTHICAVYVYTYAMSSLQAINTQWVICLTYENKLAKKLEEAIVACFNIYPDFDPSEVEEIFRSGQLTLGRSLNSVLRSASLTQCCATFPHSRHTKHCRRVMAAHQPHFAYFCGGGGVSGGDGLWHWLAATTYKSTPIEKCSIWCS
jgi:hypothetical protein